MSSNSCNSCNSYNSSRTCGIRVLFHSCSFFFRVIRVLFYSFNSCSFLFLIICFIALAGSASAQNLMGYTGLVTVPTARMQEDGSLSLGVSYFDKTYQDYSYRKYDVGMVYANLDFLPFLEVTLRINRMLNYPSKFDYTVDRTPMLKLRLFKEKKVLPAVAIGIHDFFAAFGGEKAKRYSATYVVFSKKIAALDFHLGYAPAIMEAGNRQLDGIFYGVDYRPCRWINLMGEYDTRYFNAGARLNCGKHLSFNAGLINGDSFAGGVNFRMQLSTKKSTN